MDAHQSFGYGVTRTTSLPTAPLIPNKLFGSLKFEIRNSASSLNTSQEQHSSPTITTTTDDNSSLGSNTYHFNNPSPPSLVSQDAYCSQNIKDALQELETALMGPDDVDEDDDVTTTSSDPSFGGDNNNNNSSQPSGDPWSPHVVVQSPPPPRSYNTVSSDGVRTEKRHKSMENSYFHNIPSGNLKQLLVACARAFSENNMDDFETLIEKARSSVSISGEPIQRLGAYLVEGLVARKEASGANIYRALRCREPASKDLLSYMHILYEICPYLKFGYMAANGAIAEACKNEDRIHIVDFQIAQGTQWMTLLQALGARPSGAPHVRITGIDDPVSKYARGDGLEAVGKRFSAISEKFKIPVEFHAVPVYAPDITIDMLDVRPGEALAVNFPLQLHHTPDESVDVTNPRDGLLRMIKSLSPKVITLIEQESNTNTTPFLNRFIETLDYYSAMFESIDATMARDRKERISVEQHCLARDIVNIIACEGKERVERHELLGKWKCRLTMAGFRQYPLSSYVNSVIGSLLRCYSEHYTLVEKDGAMLLGWKKRNLVSASAWH